jgi:hypothetical protein
MLYPGGPDLVLEFLMRTFLSLTYLMKSFICLNDGAADPLHTMAKQQDKAGPATSGSSSGKNEMIDASKLNVVYEANDARFKILRLTPEETERARLVQCCVSFERNIIILFYKTHVRVWGGDGQESHGSRCARVTV